LNTSTDIQNAKDKFHDILVLLGWEFDESQRSNPFYITYKFLRCGKLETFQCWNNQHATFYNVYELVR
jgi:hypothetical protein